MPFKLKALRRLLARKVGPWGRGRTATFTDEADALYEQGDLEAASARYRQALAIDPENAGAHYKLGVALQRLGRSPEAIAHYEAAHALDPTSPKPLVNWGNALKDLGDLMRASELYRKALERDPRDMHALNNLATIAQERGDLDAAEDLYLRASLAGGPGYVDAELNLALISLRRGQFAHGWDKYELRLRNDAPVSRPALDAIATGDLGADRRVAVFREQGVGDQILFSTLLPELAMNSATCIAESDPRLMAAYRRSLPGIEFAETIPEAEAKRADLRLALGSLPRLFRRDAGDFARQPERLLLPDAGRVHAYRRKIGEGIAIAIAWRSFQGFGRLHLAGRKSAPLAAFGELELPSVRLIDLQYGDVAAERAEFDARHPGLRLDLPGLDRFADLEGVMAVLAASDLVITTSNITAHLAGAVGARTWLVYLEDNAPFHYWVPRADGRSLWYPSVEVVTDARWSSWQDAFRSIAAKLHDERPALEAASRVRRGDMLYHAGDPGAAKDAYASALSLHSACARAHFNLAVIFAEEGRSDVATGHYRQCLAVDPRFTRAMVNLGNLLKERAELDEAVALYRNALAVDPRDAHALNNLAAIELERDDALKASELYARAARAGHASARIGVGRSLHRLGDHEGAIEAFRAVLADDPDSAAAHHGCGLAHLARGRVAEAIACHKRAVELEPAFVKAWVDLSEALRRLGRHEEAKEANEAALSAPCPKARASELATISAARLRSGDIGGARIFANRALHADPGSPTTRFNASVVALFEQDFPRAWDGYRLRFQVPPWPKLTPTNLPEPESLEQPRVRRLAIRKEQGVGDQILFSTLLPEVSARDIEAVVEIDERLVPAYSRSFPRMRFVSARESPTAFVSCDHQLPMGSLARYLRRTREDFSRQSRATLVADGDRIEAVRAALPAGEKIGISWRSFRDRLGDIKSFGLERFAVFEGAGPRLVDLQYGDVDEERQRFEERHPGLRIAVPGLNTRDDLDGLLAAIEACDLVVTCSNVTAHLAGALGKRTWVVYLHGAAPFHYWVPGPGGQSLWYPSVEVLTRPEWSTWERAFEAIARRWKAK